MMNLGLIGRMAALVVAVKFLLGLLDLAPLFFLGDSATYLSAAIEGYLPVDRSFTYPRLLTWLAVYPGSLTGVLIAQMASGAVASLLLGFSLFRYARVRPGIAMAASLALALDPLNVVHERLVLTESLALLGYAGVLTLGLAYVERPRFLVIAATCALGVALVSLRFVFIPLVLLFPLLLVAIAGVTFRDARLSGPRWLVLAAHLLGAVVLTGWMHHGYRAYVGRHFRGHPGYQHMDGLMLLGAWSPMVEANDTPNARFAAIIAQLRQDSGVPSGLRLHREAQIWQPGGLAETLVRDVFAGDRIAANAAAKQACRTAVFRDPRGIASLGAMTWIEYLNPSTMQERILVEQGWARPLDERFLQVVRVRFGFDAARIHLVLTPARSYHRFGWPWYIVLALSPLLNLAAVFVVPREQRPAALLLAVCAMLLMVVTVLTAPGAVVRYLQPFTVTAWAAIALLVSAAIPRPE